MCPSIYLAESVAKKGNKVLYYYFVQRSHIAPWAQWMGVAHFEETPFVFGYPLTHPAKFTESERLLSLEMVDVWTTFAKSG